MCAALAHLPTNFIDEAQLQIITENLSIFLDYFVNRGKKIKIFLYHFRAIVAYVIEPQTKQKGGIVNLLKQFRKTLPNFVHQKKHFVMILYILDRYEFGLLHEKRNT